MQEALWEDTECNGFLLNHALNFKIEQSRQIGLNIEKDNGNRRLHYSSCCCVSIVGERKKEEIH